MLRRENDLATPVCYPDVEHVPSVKGGLGYLRLGAPVVAEQILYRFQITLPSDGAVPFVSPLFLSNPGTSLGLALSAAKLAEYAKWPDLPVETAQ